MPKLSVQCMIVKDLRVWLLSDASRMSFSNSSFRKRNLFRSRAATNGPPCSDSGQLAVTAGRMSEFFVVPALPDPVVLR